MRSKETPSTYSEMRLHLLVPCTFLLILLLQAPLSGESPPVPPGVYAHCFYGTKMGGPANHQALARHLGGEFGPENVHCLTSCSLSEGEILLPELKTCKSIDHCKNAELLVGPFYDIDYAEKVLLQCQYGSIRYAGTLESIYIGELSRGHSSPKPDSKTAEALILGWETWVASRQHYFSSFSEDFTVRKIFQGAEPGVWEVEIDDGSVYSFTKVADEWLKVDYSP